MSEQTISLKIWNAAKSLGLTDAGAAAVCGNAQAESALIENNLENSKERPLGMNDAQYTAAVDNGSYSNFVYDSAGFGIFQLTHWSRKKAYFDLVRTRGVSIADVDAQLDYFKIEMTQDFPGLLSLLRASNDVKTCSDAFMVQFENPADKSEGKKMERYRKSMTFYNEFSGKGVVGESKGDTGIPTFPPDQSIMILQAVLNYNGYKCRADGYKDEAFMDKLREFVADIGG